MRVLGLDLGTNSIGWALVNQEDHKIEGAGVRIFKMGVVKESLGKGDKEESLNAQRRVFRQMRRQYFRRRMRKVLLLKALMTDGMCPMSREQWSVFRLGKGLIPSGSLKEWFALNPYELRSKGLTERLEQSEVGRVLYHLSQRRGFESSSRSSEADEDGVLFTGKDGKVGILETEKAVEANRTLGSYLNSIQQPKYSSYQKDLPRLRNRYTTRDMYFDEFTFFWRTQSAYNPALTNALRLKYGGYKKKGDPSDGILFFRRPLKSQKKSRGKCIFEKDKQRCHASHPLAEKFRIWQFVNQIEMTNLVETDGLVWNDRHRREAFEFLMNQSKSVKFLALRKKLKLADARFRFNYDDETSCPAAHTIASLSSKALFGSKWFVLDDDKQEEIWHVLLDFDDRKALIEHSQKHWGFENEIQFKALSRLRLDGKFASLSRKAIQNILPYLEKGLMYHEAVAMGGVRAAFGVDWESLSKEQIEKYEEGCIRRLKEDRTLGVRDVLIDYLTSDEVGLPIERMGRLYHHSELNKRVEWLVKFPTNLAADRRILALKNPVVVKAMFEVRKVMNAVIERYGKPDVVRVEMARDLKNTRSQRADIQREQRRLEARNADVRARLTEYGFALSHENILKYTLYQECDHTCVYTGRSIGIDDLFRTGKVQIEHIRPWSRSLDDSFVNKTLCFVDENLKKRDRTPFEYYSQMGDVKWQEVKNRALRTFYTSKEWPDRYKKFKRFVDEKFEDEGFIQRQLNDTRYIAREVSSYLTLVFPKVETYPGQMTARLRSMWGMNSILNKENPSKNRDDHRHHAVDALVLACSEIRYLQELTRWNQYGERTGSAKDFPKPWALFRQDAERVIQSIWVSHDQTRPPISTRNVVIELPGGRKAVNRGVAVRGALHKETVFGKRKTPITGEEGFHVRKPLESITDETQLKKVVDPEIRKLLLQAIDEVGGFESKKEKSDENGKEKNRKIPKGAFFSTTESGERIPKVFLPNRKGGDPVPVLKVRTRENMSNAVALHSDQNAYVNPRNNHHILIYEDVNGDWQEEIVSFWEAVERKRQGLDVYRLPADGVKLLYIFEENRFFKVHPKWFLKENPTLLHLEEVVVRVQKISSNYYTFRLVNAATLEVDNEEVRIQSMKKLKDVTLIEIRIDELGRFVEMN